jgi:hypothetical protein
MEQMTQFGPPVLLPTLYSEGDQTFSVKDSSNRYVEGKTHKRAHHVGWDADTAPLG